MELESVLLGILGGHTSEKYSKMLKKKKKKNFASSREAELRILIW